MNDIENDSEAQNSENVASVNEELVSENEGSVNEEVFENQDQIINRPQIREFTRISDEQLAAATESNRTVFSTNSILFIDISRQDWQLIDRREAGSNFILKALFITGHQRHASDVQKSQNALVWPNIQMAYFNYSLLMYARQMCLQ